MVIKNIIARIKAGKGQDMMEFAITLPVLALLAFGIFDLGNLLILKQKNH